MTPENRPKILHLLPALAYGGMEVYLARLIAGDGGRFVHVVASLSPESDPHAPASYTRRLESAGATVRTLDLRAGQVSLGALARLAAMVRVERPHLLNAWSHHAHAATIALRLSGLATPVVWNLRGDYPRWGKEKPLQVALVRANRFGARMARRIVANAQLNADAYIRHGYPAAAIAVIENGFDTTAFTPDAGAREATRARLGCARGETVVGMVARVHPQKDYATFLRAAVRLADAGAPYRFLAAGRGTDRLADDPALAPLVARLGPRFVGAGHVDDTASLCNALDIAVLSSAFGEGLPNALGEAMACGVPCVGTAIGAVPELIGETGRIVPPSDPAALAAAIESVRAAGAAALGRQARARIEARFAFSRSAERFYALWVEAMAVHPPAP